MTFFNVHGPVYVFYDLLAKWFGVDTVSVTTFNDGFQRTVAAAALPPATAPLRPFAAIGHGCSDLGRERQLRPDEWRRLLRPLLLAGHDIVFFGGPGDSAAANAIIAELGQGRNLCGKLSITQSAKIIGRAYVYYGIDSMLLHLARALRVQTVSVFGPTDPSTRLRPLGQRERVAYARMPCSPCIHVNEIPPCRGARTCMALALESVVAFPDREPAVTQSQSCPPSLGWDVDPSGPRVREVSVTYS